MLFTGSALAASISGTVYEDVNYGGGVGRDLATAQTAAVGFSIPRGGVRVELYDAAGNYLDNTTTATDGTYFFNGVPGNGTRIVRVVNSTVTSTRAGGSSGELAVQTFRFDGVAEAPGTGANKVGGERPNLVDAPANSSQPLAALQGGGQYTQSIVTVQGGHVGVDFGFNFDTVVNANNAGQGSLRQFITNANVLGDEASLAQNGNRIDVNGTTQPLPTGYESSIFMISDGNAHPGLLAGIANQLTGGVAVITPATTLPAITGANTAIDGTTQTVNIGNTNMAVLGSGGTVGVGLTLLPTVPGPEVEIAGSPTRAKGLWIQADYAIVRGLSIHGFGNDENADGGIVLTNSVTNALIESNVLGSGPASFTDLGAGNRNISNIAVFGANNGTVQHNLIGFSGQWGIRLLSNATNIWLIQSNEFRGNASNLPSASGHDAIDIQTDVSQITVSGNLLTDTKGASGVDTWQSSGANVIEDNTITLNGQGGNETSGVRLFGTGNTVRRNLIQSNSGPGVLVVRANGSQPGTPSTSNLISQNSFSTNGRNAIDLVAAGGNNNRGDGITPNDLGATDSNAGNIGIDYPVIASATKAGSTTTITGTAATPATSVEVYIAIAGAGDGPAPGQGEGVQYLGTAAVASGNWTLNFTDGTVVLNAGALVSAIAIDGNKNTSEFSANVEVLPGADLSLTKSDGTAAVNVGGTLTYTLTIANAGPNASGTGITVSDTLPANVTVNGGAAGALVLGGANGADWSCNANGASPQVVSCTTTASIASGANSAFTFTTDALPAVLAGTTLNNSATVVADPTVTDTVPANNTGSDTDTAVGAQIDLSLTKVVNNATPTVGANVIFTLTVANAAGMGNGTGVVVTDALPSGYAYVSDDGGAATTVAGNTVTWNVGNLAQGTNAVLNITAQVLGAGVYQNNAEVTAANEPDTDSTPGDGAGDDFASATTAPTAQIDLSLAQVVDNSTPVVGNTVTFTLTATNASGFSDATGVVITDTIPAGYVYMSDTGGATTSMAGNTLSWTLPGPLPQGSNATLSMTLQVLATGPYNNDAEVTAAGEPDIDSVPGDGAGDDFVSTTTTPLPGLVLHLTKSAGKTQVAVGGIVTYQVGIANTITTDVPGVTIVDQLPPNFKYVSGSARLNGAPLADPSGSQTLTFDIGTVPALVDGNGNGVADPGEPGYMVLVYQLVVGSGATPGDYENSATATNGCSTCAVSNTGSFTIAVTQDPVLDLGTIIGKVFEDKNADGFQNPDEPGVAGVMVALDNGTYALTDEYGRYHFPGAAPGQRMVKINLQSVPGVATVTTDESVILSITPGLLAKANFGIRYTHMLEKIGRPGQLGVMVQAETNETPIRVLGDAESMTVLVNDMMAALPQSDLQLRTEALDDAVEYNGNHLKTPVAFSAQVDTSKTISDWRLLIRDSADKIVRTLHGRGKPPSAISWDGLDDAGKTLQVGAIYQYQLEADLADGTKSLSVRRLFGINRATAVSLNLSGGAFDPGSDALTPRAIKLLKQTAEVIRQYPKEKIVIEGHTDWEGTAEYNMDLSKRRATAALTYLVNVEHLPADQFVLRWYGESRPIASNESPEGREINRRVEISSTLTKVEKAKVLDQYRNGQPLVKVDQTRATVGDDGRFATELMANDKDYVNIEVADSKGGYTEGSVPLPKLEILQLPKELRLPLGTRTYRYQVSKSTAPGATADAVTVSYRLVGRTTPGNVVELDGHSLHVDEKGFFVAELPLKQGNNVFGLVVRNKAGFMRIANLRMLVSGADGNSPLVVTDPIPNLAVRLPPPGVPVTSEQLAIPGETDPGNTVLVNGESVDVRSDGTFLAHVKLPFGETRLVIEVKDPQGHTGSIERVITRKPGLFLLAFGDATFTKLNASGYIQGAGMDKPSETLTEGRVAYYLKGTIRGKYLITSAFDSGVNQFDQLFDNLDQKQNDRLLTNLDPDKFYPVYGDSSTIVYDAESQSKFFLAIDSEEMHALVGNYPLQFTDTELATYQRTLYGARFAYKSLSQTTYNQPKTKAEVFAAEVRQAKVSDELRATGGSLYFLSQRAVIQGSEHVTIVVRDKDTHLELSRVPQQQNVDYTIKYEEGRIIFNRPISSVQADDRLVNQDLLHGNPVFIQVDYEARVDAFEQTNSGARVRQQIGNHVGVGATYVKEDKLSSEYELTGLDTEFRFGKNSRVVAEVAQSKGTDAITFSSDDGGYTYLPVAPSGTQEGDAYKLGAELDVGEWFGKPDRFQVGAYVRSQDEGFSSDGTLADRGTDKSGINFSYKINKKDTLRGRHDRQEKMNDPAESIQSTLQWEHEAKRWRLRAEVQDNNTTDSAGLETDSTTAAARIDGKLTKKLLSFLEVQHTLDGPENNQTTAGIDYKLNDKLALGAQVTVGNLGNSAQAGLSYQLGKHKFYVNERLVDDSATGRSRMTVVGTQSDIGKSSTFYTEYQWAQKGDNNDSLSLIGLRRRWDLGHGLNVLFMSERSEIDTDPEKTTRYALATGVTYDNGKGLLLSTRNEWRLEEGGRDLQQFLTTNRAEYLLNPDLKMLGWFRYSLTQDSSLTDTETEFTEFSLGLAYRPIANDRFNALFRYTRQSNEPTLFQSQTLDSSTKSDIFSTDWSYQVTRKLEWVGKAAMKYNEESTVGLPTVDNQIGLLIQRFNYNFYKKFELGAEYRIRSQSLANDQEQGWLLEFMWRPVKQLRLGVGYNFTDFSDDEFSNNDFSVKGWFFRLQGAY